MSRSVSGTDEALPDIALNRAPFWPEFADIVRSFGAEPVFLTYASAMWNYGDASHALRSAAAASEVRVIDAAVPIAAVCSAEPCPDWLYADHHPTVAGYRVMAEEVVRQLAERW
jgi:hypothetical protein